MSGLQQAATGVVGSASPSEDGVFNDSKALAQALQNSAQAMVEG